MRKDYWVCWRYQRGNHGLLDTYFARIERISGKNEHVSLEVYSNTMKIRYGTAVREAKFQVPITVDSNKTFTD